MRREVDTTEAFRGQMLRPESMLRVVRVHAGTVILPELSEKLGILDSPSFAADPIHRNRTHFRVYMDLDASFRQFLLCIGAELFT